MTYCALCTRPTSDPRRRPLGRDDAMVNICAGCDDDPAVVRTGPTRDYDVPDKDPGRGELRDRFAAAANRVTGPRNNRPAPPMAKPTPGWIVVRVGRTGEQGPIDSQTARASLASKPWFKELRHLGTDTKWHLFERPDSEAARRAREGDPLSEAIAKLEWYRVQADGVAR